MFGVDRCSVYTRLIKSFFFSTLGIILMYGLYSISIHSGFCLDRFHCIWKISCQIDNNVINRFNFFQQEHFVVFEKNPLNFT